MEGREVARVPRLAQPGGAEVPVRADLARDVAQVVPEVDGRGAAPEPVAVVDAVDHEPRLEHERVRDHRVVLGVGVLLDVQVLLDDAPWVGEERPLSADRGAELLKRVMLVGRDRRDLGVRHGDLGIEGRELEVLLVLLWAVVTASEREDEGVVALKLAEPPRDLRMIGQLVVRERAAGRDVGAHRGSPLCRSGTLSAGGVTGRPHARYTAASQSCSCAGSVGPRWRARPTEVDMTSTDA